MGKNFKHKRKKTQQTSCSTKGMGHTNFEPKNNKNTAKTKKVKDTPKQKIKICNGLCLSTHTTITA